MARLAIHFGPEAYNLVASDISRDEMLSLTREDALALVEQESRTGSLEMIEHRLQDAAHIVADFKDAQARKPSIEEQIRALQAKKNK